MSFTGITRKRVTSRKVRIAERIARIAITIGGIGTIVAVTTICVFLVWVVLPLFGSGTLEKAREVGLARSDTRPSGAPIKVAVDEYRVLVWTIDAGGALLVCRLDNGEAMDRHDLFPGVATAWAFGIGDGRVAFGFADGSIREASVDFGSALLAPDQVPESFRGAPTGAVATLDRAAIVRLPDGQVRRQWVSVRGDEPVVAPSGAAVVLVDQAFSSGRELLCVLRADDSLVMDEIVRTKNLLTDQEKVEVTEAKLPYRKREGAGAPRFLRISERGDQVYLAWTDGHLARFDCRNLDKPALAEETDLVSDPTTTLTCLEFMNGRSTLIAGDSAGGVRGWFGTKPPDTRNPDGIVMRMAHEFPPHGAAVTACAPSTRTRLFVTGDAAGRVRVAQMTTEKIIAESAAPEGLPVVSIQLAPKNDGVVALLPGRLAGFALDPAYSVVSFRTIVLPVWYEGATGPEHVWQSGGGSDDYEPKLGLMPLVFGTLKATFYSLLFSVPLALLAALYTSEFLNPRTKSVVKSAIEMMASLPSVVLGFLAALVLAPLVEDVVPAVLLAFIAVPATFFGGAFLWQALPMAVATRLGGAPRFLAIACLLPVGILLAAKLGPGFEGLFFQGDIKMWLDGQIRGTTGGWTLLLLPLSAIAVVVLFSRVVNPRLLAASVDWSHGRSAAADLVKVVAGAALTAGLAWAAASLLDAAGFDPRGSLFGTYIQRNAMIVGFVMGFAVIPIIYTLAEDALASVPVHLRSASLGCGATRWQTATRIVLPTALSGIFSAVMVGLGRAVGETMVVLMAAGNTPVLNWNMFSGFRTLSANIAVELPEAVQGSAHYRVLFLAALTLFGITFVLNTAAEVVRLRFRKRAYQL